MTFDGLCQTIRKVALFWRFLTGWSDARCHFQKTTARNIRSQPHDLLRCQL